MASRETVAPDKILAVIGAVHYYSPVQRVIIDTGFAAFQLQRYPLPPW